MRYKKFRLVVAATLLALGGLALFIGFFAFQLHLDNNQVMGDSRKLLAFLGTLSMGFAFWLAFSEQITSSWLGRTTSQLFARAINFLAYSKFAKLFSGVLHKYKATAFFAWFNRNPWIYAVTSAALVIFVYFWYITGAKWAWTDYSNSYDMLANAFLRGSIALLEKPSAALMNLANPYDYLNREGVDYIWDATFFNGKYYLYWGFVPALFAAAVKGLHPSTVEDQQLVFFFLSGLAVVLSATFHWLRGRYFPRSPAWMTGFFTLAALLSLPLIWIVNRAMVYEAAIAGGQFFLLLGLYSALRAMDSPRKSPWLFLSGFAWGAAVNSRANYALAVFWFVALITVFLLFRLKKPSAWIRPLFFLFLPLLVSAVGFGWYNFARFGSILETGHRYQLTGVAMPEEYGQITSLNYIIPNLYNYLARPFGVLPGEFPFVDIPYITDDMWPWYIPRPPGIYAAKQITGIFISIPIIWLIFLPVLKPLEYIWFWAKEKPRPRVGSDPDLKWVWGMILGSLGIMLASIAIFIAANMRYLVDIISLLFLLLGTNVWWALGFLERAPGWRTLLIIILVVLGVEGILIGLLAGFVVDPHRFENINPSLYHMIANFLTGK
jgi:hypothetical protein